MYWLKNVSQVVVFLSLFLFHLSLAVGGETAERYDLAYIWDNDLESVLDYKQELESLFDGEVSKRLKIVGRGNEYGVIYDTNGSSRTIIQEIALHGEVLRKAGLAEAYGIKDHGYYELFNVSYGLGPNLESLKRTYEVLYAYLGKEVGKNLFIEKTSGENYALIYRRRGNRQSTLAIAKKHAKLLRAKRIRASITPENNNPVVYGESSHLDDSEEDSNDSPPPLPVVATSKEVTPRIKEVKKVAGPAHGPSAPQLVAQDRSFEESIEEFIKNLRKNGKIRGDEKTGWMVYDLASDVSLVDINADEMFQAASMIKPFVALAFFHKVKSGKLVYGPKSRRMMEAMIQRSSNSATNWVMKQAGGPAACEAVLQQNYGHIFKKTEIREYIPASGRTYRNSALPSDYIRFLRALWNHELPYGKELRRVMALPGRDRLYHGTPIPQGTLVYNKTGSTAHLCGDMGILVPKTRNGSRYPYAIVGIIERSSRPADYGSWMLTRSNVIRQVSTLVYEQMKKRHRLL